ncbi:MAG: 50S ribosomal protein L18 [Bacteroidota bacterium]|nr:50S ribosomal protein L18 [Bacteroidota bacterium]
MAFNKIARRNKIRNSIRKSLKGNAKKPRLSVFRSNKQIYAQLIDDEMGRTILAASSRETPVAENEESKTIKSQKVGKLIAQRAKENGIEEVVFDRGGYLYHGRIKSLAEAAREEGLKF